MDNNNLQFNSDQADTLILANQIAMMRRNYQIFSLKAWIRWFNHATKRFISIINQNNVEEFMLNVINAYQQGNFDQAETLIKNSLNINIKDNSGLTLLHHMTKQENSAAIQHLLIQGAYVNQGDDFGNTPLHISTLKKNIRIISLLLEYGANPYQKNQMGFDAINLAQNNNQYGVAGIIKTIYQDLHLGNSAMTA